MRLPGTYNILSNDLPTPEFLNQYKALKKKQREAEAAEKTEKEAQKAWKNRFKQVPGEAALKLLEKDRLRKAAKTGGDGKKEAKKENEGGKKDEAKKEMVNEGGFTEAQDKALLEHKLKETFWATIAIELGKDVELCKARWKEIQPSDFAKQLADAKAAKKGNNGGNGGGKKNGGNSGGGNGGGGNNEKKNGNAGDGGGGGGGGGGAGADKPPPGLNKKQRTKWFKDQAAAKEKKGEGGDDGGGGDKEDDGDAWWEEVDENWTKEDLEKLLRLCNEELKTAFGQMSKRFAEETGKQVHPASIAEKITGSAPADWK